MQVLKVRQTSGLRARVEFEGGDWEVELHDPLDAQQEENLRWYFEEHLEFPMLDTVRAEQAAQLVRTYGNSLFEQVFTEPELRAAFKTYNPDQIRVEISGEPEFHRLHWEALWDPKDAQPLAHRAVVARAVHRRGAAKFAIPGGPAIRVLVVVARPWHGRDVGYRTISRPLVETLHQAELDVELEFVRPGTWEQLKRQVGARPQGHYHALHFDGHGAVEETAEMERQRREGHLLFGGEAAGNGGRQAYLFFESPATANREDERPRAVTAAEMAAIVNDARIPIVILNACQSGKQESEPETNLASQLAAAGVRSVLGMAYSVTVTAARRFMSEFYAAAFGGKVLSEAVTCGRRHLRDEKNRSAYFGSQIELEDWILPVLYENEEVRVKIRATEEEKRALLARRAEAFQARPLDFRFWGRDLDILNIERQVLSRTDANILLIEGMGGTGKTTLVQHLAWWWQTTGLISGVFVFEYDQKPWTRQQILFEISRRLNLRVDPNEKLHQEEVARRLRAERYLLVLDNLESVTGEQLAVGQSLSQSARNELRELLSKLRGGKTLVLLGSRSKEEWLAKDVFRDNVYALGGLDREAGSSFADEILGKAGADAEAIRKAPEYRELLSLLDGHPLAMQVVLSNLGVKTPGEVLRALREGDVRLDRGESRTESILKCVDYSHSNLPEESKALLESLAPFTGVVLLTRLDAYIALLQAQPDLADLHWERLAAAIAEAERWGLVRTDGQILRLQPVFPFFLRSRGDSNRRVGIERAFREHYRSLCEEIVALQDSKAANERQIGQAFGKLEYENAFHALELALAAQASILGPYMMLSMVLDESKDNAGGLALARQVMKSLDNYAYRLLAGSLGLEMVGIVDNAAKRLLLLRKFSEAKLGYEKALDLLRANESGSLEVCGRVSAGIYHQLGRIAQEQRQWAEAEKNYREALRIKVEFNDRYAQASTYHQLGVIAHEQRQWAEAEKNYREALRIFVEFNDRHSQASTYHQLGRIAEEQRQWAEAEKNYREALRIYVEFNDRYAQAATYHQLGMIAQAQREWAEAEKNYREALRIYVEFNDRYAQAGTYHQLGVIAQAQRQWAEAEKNYREALRIKVEFNDRYAQASTYHQLGMIAEEQQQWGEAEKNYREALQIFIEFDDNYSTRVVLKSFARLAPECTGLAERVSELIGTTVAETEELFRKLRSNSGSGAAG